MTEREFKVGDRVNVTSKAYTSAIFDNNARVIEVLDHGITVGGVGFDWFYLSGNGVTHADPVPIGYTGKLKDMDLQDGDVVLLADKNYTATNGTVCGKPFHYWVLDFTLVSRANQWSNWQMSRKDGTYDSSPQREYETQALPDTDQVTYRWRKAKVKEPVITTKVWEGHWDSSSDIFYDSPPSRADEYPCKITVTLKDGVPTSMTGEFL